jgi:hypothetical protein
MNGFFFLLLAFCSCHKSSLTLLLEVVVLDVLLSRNEVEEKRKFFTKPKAMKLLSHLFINRHHDVLTRPSSLRSHPHPSHQSHPSSISPYPPRDGKRCDGGGGKRCSGGERRRSFLGTWHGGG